MTMVKEKREDKWYIIKKIEEHYAMIGELGSFYLCHLMLKRSICFTIADR